MIHSCLNIHTMYLASEIKNIVAASSETKRVSLSGVQFKRSHKENILTVVVITIVVVIVEVERFA